MICILFICFLNIHLVKSNESTTKIASHLTPVKFCISPSSEYDVSILIEYIIYFFYKFFIIIFEKN